MSPIASPARDFCGSLSAASNDGEGRPTLRLVTSVDGEANDPDIPPPFVTEFLEGRSPLTARRYLGALRQFAQWRGQGLAVAISSLLDTGEREARGVAWRYRTFLIDDGRAPSTINVALAALVAVARAARHAGAIDWSLEVEPLSVQSYRDTRGPGTAGTRAIVDAAMRQPDARRRARDVCMVNMLFALGLRRSELVRLDLEHLECDANGLPAAVWIRGKARTSDERLTLPSGVQRAMAEWLAVRGTDDGPLFVSNAARHQASYRRLSGDGLAHVLRVLSTSAGLTRVTPHGIRHAAVTAALDAGTDLRDCAKFSRHRNLNTLVIYDDARRDTAGRVAGRLDKLLG